ncbi:tRNA glutamyl-Q(34) synthetase GluQRS [Undibacterium sp. Ji22W]|uniref:tRNA glutamyl-Q(34) synthetase GluQRS n=1 Tax=Undibacterium sp. Ji22W TaxID=3413038 RepID=UPI003BF2034C
MTLSVLSDDCYAMLTYRGRFAPSPTGPLHFGSLVAAVASYLDAKAHRGSWLVRIEDVDFDRNVAGADHALLRSLQRCGMKWDEEITWQSQRGVLYQAALDQLGRHVFACSCSRKEIADSRLRAGLSDSQIYPGTCRAGIADNKVARAYRLRVPDGAVACITFEDRLLGMQSQDLSTAVGDFVLKRADGFWAYQLAVVVDDATQGITDVVRGADLLDSSARQIYMQGILNYSTPRYLHVPVVINQNGEKLSKQTGAIAFDRGDNNLLQEALIPAAQFLGLIFTSTPQSIPEFWSRATELWAGKFGIQ